MADRHSRGRRLRGPVLFAGAALILLILGPRLVPTGGLGDRLAAELARATGAEVVLGRASLRLVPRPGLVVDGGSLRGSGTEIGLESYAMDLASVEIDLAVGPLLQRRLEVRSALLAGPALRLAWDDGEAFLEDFELGVSGLALAEGTAVPADPACDLAVAAARVTIDGRDYAPAAAAGRLADRILTVTGLRAGRGPGEIRAAGAVDFASDPRGRLEFEAIADGVPAGLLLEGWVPDLARRLETDLDAAVKGSCALGDGLRARRTLRLVGRAAAGSGRLDAVDWLAEAGRYLGDRQDLKVVTFDRLDHAFRLEQGRYHVARLDLAGGPTEWGGTGWLDLSGLMDLDVGVRLPVGFTPDLGALSFMAEGLRDDEGRVNLAFALRGPTDRPAFVVDLGNLTGGARRPDDSAAVAEIENGMGGLLDKWRGR